MKTLEILCGIPCSGKSTYALKEYNKPNNSYYVSRDEIRIIHNLNQYTNQSENKVTELFNIKVQQILCLDNDVIAILDNTHCKEKYIDEIIKKYPEYNNDNINQ